MITAPRLTPDQILLVQQLLQTYSNGLLNQPMILPIYSRLLRWFDENNIQTLTVINNNTNTNTNSSNPSPTPLPRSPTNGKFVCTFGTTNNKISSTDEHDQMKKSSMKTVEDVLAYIDKDPRFNKHLIRIGYIDHSLGLQEKAYNDFDRTSKCSIQSLKYANELIWDKESRIDLIFGSTGSQQTISDVIKRHELK